VADVGELLNLKPASQESESITGYLDLKLKPLARFTSARAVGAVTFSGNGGRARSTLPMLREGKTETIFLQVAQSNEIGLFTGLAILNAGSEAATLTVRAFDANGKATALKKFELNPETRVVDLLNGEKFFGQAFSQVGGYLELSSSVPVFSFSLFGDFKSELLSAIVGQTGIR